MQLVEARDLDTSPPEWLAEGMIPRVGVGILHGRSYIGKSLVTDNELALAVANGALFFGHECVQGSVVLCLGEGLYDAGCRIKARLARQVRDDDAAVAAIAARGGDEAAAAYRAALPPYTDDNLFVIPEPFDVPLTRARDLSALARGVITMIRAMAGSPELVILDALADFTGGLSLSNDASANRLMLGLKRIAAELDCCVLAVAHDDKTGSKMLGAQRLYNASDFVIGLTASDTAPGAGETVALTCEKSKYGPEFEPLSYRIEKHYWEEPELDADREPTGAMVTVTSASVRLVDGSAVREQTPARDERVHPDLRDVEPPRKRNGLRPNLHLVSPRYRLG